MHPSEENLNWMFLSICINYWSYFCTCKCNERATISHFPSWLKTLMDTGQSCIQSKKEWHLKSLEPPVNGAKRIIAAIFFTYKVESGARSGCKLWCRCVWEVKQWPCVTFCINIMVHTASLNKTSLFFINNMNHILSNCCVYSTSLVSIALKGLISLQWHSLQEHECRFG